MSQIEKRLVLFVSAIVICLFSTWKYYQFFDGSGDNAMLLELTENIASTGRPMTKTMVSMDLILKELLTIPANELCQRSLDIPHTSEINYFKSWHTYGVLYLIAPLVWIFGAQLTLSILTILSFFTVLIVTYILIRKNSLSVGTALIGCLLVSSHPAWSQSLQGQVYADRLLIGILFGLILLLIHYPHKRLLILLLSLIATSISDRMGIITGGLLIGHEILSYKKGHPVDLFKIIIGALCFALSAYLVKIYVQHPHYKSFSNSLTPQGFIGNLQLPDFVSNLKLFLILNFVGFGLFAAFSWRLFLLAAGLMIPNIFGNMGGAEKANFLTHYHTTYIPVFLWAVSSGFIELHKKKHNLILGNKKYLANGLAIIVAISALSLAPYHSGFTLHTSHIKNSWLYVGIKDFGSYIWGSKGQILKNRMQILDQIPKGSTITTIEHGMPIYIHNNIVHLYPAGFPNSDFISLPYQTGPKGERSLLGAITYLGPDVEREMNLCLTERLRQEGFPIEKGTDYGGFLLIKKDK